MFGELCAWVFFVEEALLLLSFVSLLRRVLALPLLRFTDYEKPNRKLAKSAPLYRG